MKKTDLQSTLNRFVSFFRSGKQEKNDDNLSTKTGGPRMERRADISDTSEFDDYLERAPNREVQKMKSKKGATSRTVIHNSVNMELVQKCYRNIPQRYFKQCSAEDAVDAKLFCRERRKLQESQQRIAGHLDEIELCLFNQVTSRFDEFVSVLMAIESLDLLVKENLMRLGKLRQGNADHEKRFAEKARRVCHLQLKVNNMRKLADVMQRMKRLQTGKEFIRANILRDKDSCTSLIEELRKDGPLMQQLQCISEDYEDKIEECQFVIKKDFTESFTQEMFTYVAGAGQYKQEFWQKLANYPGLVEGDHCDMTNTSLVLDEQTIYDDRNSYDPAIERTIVDIVLNGWRNGELAVDSTKGRLGMFLNKLYDRFIADLYRFCCEVLKERQIKYSQGSSISDLLGKMSIEFFVKMAQYYSSLHMNYLKRMFSVCRPLLNQLLLTTTNIEQSLRTQLHILIDKVLTFELAVVQLVLDKVMQLINLKKLGCNSEFYRFRSYMRLFESWELFFSGEAAQLVNYTIPADCTCKDRVYVLKNKLNGHSVLNSKREVLLSFVGALHKQVIGSELKKIMEEDIWQAEDIPTSFYETISYLMAGDTWNNRRNGQTTVLESSIFVDRSLIRRGPGDRSINLRPDETMQIQRRINLKIIKNQCLIEGKTYKISKSMLSILELLEKYVRIAETFQAIQQQIGLRIPEIVRYYNKYAFELIMNAKAVSFGRIKNKNITARHLCVCSLCLELITMILKKLSERIKISQLNKVVEELTNHHSLIIDKLNSILMARVETGLKDIDLLKVPCRGTQNIVAGAKTLYDIVQDYLSQESIRRIFDKRLFSQYNIYICKLPVKDLSRAQILKEDMNFYYTELKMLESMVPEYWELRQAGDAIIVQAFESF